MPLYPLNETKTAIKILLVEDNSGDELLMKRAFSKGQYDYEIQVAKTGEVARDIILRTPPHDIGTRPDYVLLDLNLPVMSGRDVLHQIQQSNPPFRPTIFVLSSSRSEEDVTSAYHLGANAYLTKPSSTDDYKKLVYGLETFWIELAIPPHYKKD